MSILTPEEFCIRFGQRTWYTAELLHDGKYDRDVVIKLLTNVLQAVYPSASRTAIPQDLDQLIVALETAQTAATLLDTDYPCKWSVAVLTTTDALNNELTKPYREQFVTTVTPFAQRLFAIKPLAQGFITIGPVMHDLLQRIIEPVYDVEFRGWTLITLLRTFYMMYTSPTYATLQTRRFGKPKPVEIWPKWTASSIATLTPLLTELANVVALAQPPQLTPRQQLINLLNDHLAQAALHQLNSELDQQLDTLIDQLGKIKQMVGRTLRGSHSPRVVLLD